MISLKYPLFSKIKSFLAHLALTSVLLTVFLFILSKIGFSLGLNRPQIGRLTIYLVLLATLVNVGEIKAAIDKALAPKEKEKFIFYTLTNIFLTLAFLVGYAIFQYGSPLIYENHPQGFKAAKEVPLVENTVISQEFRADSNNLGTVGVRLLVQEKILGFGQEGEIVEIKPEKKVEEEVVDEEAQEEPATDQGELAEDEEPLEEIANYEPAEIIFQIKEKGAREWFYQNTYYFDQAAPAHLYPFGFPPIENSKDKTYLVEIEGKKPIAPEENNLYLFASVNRANQPYLYSRYVYTRQTLKRDWQPILNNTLNKISLNFKEEVFVFSLIFAFVFLEINAFFLAQKGKMTFLKIAEEEFSRFLVAYLSLAIIIQLGRLASQYTNWSLPDLAPLSAVNNLFLAVVIVLGGIIALTDKKS